MKFLFTLTLSVLLLYGCEASNVLTFDATSQYEFGQKVGMRCMHTLDTVPDIMGVGWSAKWKVTDKSGTSSINYQRKDSLARDYNNIPEQFKGRFESQTTVTNQGVEMVASLANVTAEDEVTYRCELEIGDDDLRSFTGQGTFKVYNKPQITIQNMNNPLNIEATEVLDNGTVVKETIDEEVVVATCEITDAYPKPIAITWFSIDDMEGDRSEVEIAGDFMEEAMMVENADKSWNLNTTLSLMPELSLHLKKFQCKVDLGLEVDGLYESEESDRMLINHPITEVKISVNKKKVHEGENLEVTCTTDGYPLNDYMKLIRKDENDVESLIEITQTQFEQRIVFIKKADRSDTGTYTCRVGDIEKSRKININYYDASVTMKASKSTDELNVGDNIEITCSHQAYPAQTVLMRRPNGDWKQTNKLIVTNGQVDDSGRYECKTRKTTVTQAAYDVQFRNTCKINMNSMLTQSSEGHMLITVKCSTPNANPACSFDIQSNDGLSSNSNDLSEPNSLSKQFVVDGNGVTELPTFTCYASNVIGKNQSNVAAPNDVLTPPPKEGGMSPGIVVVIILAVTFLLVGLPYAYYKFCKKPANQGHIKGSQLDSVEVEKLEAGDHDEYISSDNLVIEEDSHQISDHRLNTTPMRTFSIKQNNNKENLDI